MVREIKESKAVQSEVEDEDVSNGGAPVEEEEGKADARKTKRTPRSLTPSLTPPLVPPPLATQHVEKTSAELEALKSDKYGYPHYILLVCHSVISSLRSQLHNHQFSTLSLLLI